MKRLSLVCFIMLVFVLLGTGFIRKPTLPMSSRQTLYYWYSSDDTYNDRKSLNDEINEMWDYYWVPITTNPSGGVLVEKGYLTNAFPHNNYPSVYLYAHY